VGTPPGQGGGGRGPPPPDFKVGGRGVPPAEGGGTTPPPVLVLWCAASDVRGCGTGGVAAGRVGEGVPPIRLGGSPHTLSHLHTQVMSLHGGRSHFLYQ